MTIESTTPDRATRATLSPRRLVRRVRAELVEQRRLVARRSVERELRARWREACEGAGLCQWSSDAGQMIVRTPRFGALRDKGMTLAFSIELLPGWDRADVVSRSSRLARGLGFRSLQVEPISGRWMRLVLRA
jgi:DNA segregation ATPase FtsK/SpoIIIE, S-DNA-T family